MLNLAGLLGGNVASDFINGLSKLFDNLFPSPSERAQAEAIIETLRQRPLELQAELGKLQIQANTEQVKSKSVWVAGAIPYIEYVLGTALAVYFIPRFAVGTLLWIKISWASGLSHIPPYPVDASELIALTSNVLGFGALRLANNMIGGNNITLPQPFK